jgi:hypothetical protein
LCHLQDTSHQWVSPCHCNLLPSLQPVHVALPLPPSLLSVRCGVSELTTPALSEHRQKQSSVTANRCWELPCHHPTDNNRLLSHVGTNVLTCHHQSSITGTCLLPRKQARGGGGAVCDGAWVLRAQTVRNAALSQQGPRVLVVAQQSTPHFVQLP